MDFVNFRERLQPKLFNVFWWNFYQKSTDCDLKTFDILYLFGYPIRMLEGKDCEKYYIDNIAAILVGFYFKIKWGQPFFRPLLKFFIKYHRSKSMIWVQSFEIDLLLEFQCTSKGFLSLERGWSGPVSPWIYSVSLHFIFGDTFISKRISV